MGRHRTVFAIRSRVACGDFIKVFAVIQRFLGNTTTRFWKFDDTFCTHITEHRGKKLRIVD